MGVCVQGEAALMNSADESRSRPEAKRFIRGSFKVIPHARNYTYVIADPFQITFALFSQRGQSPVTSGTCCVCLEPLSIVNRHTAHGVFFHRNCFRCDTCGCVLHVGTSVYQKTDGKGMDLPVAVGWCDLRMFVSFSPVLLFLARVHRRSSHS